MLEANTLFDRYRKCVNGEIDDDCDEALRRYQAARSKISKDNISAEKRKWNELTKDNNSKKLWEKIDWKGNFSKETHQSPIFDGLTVHFENLYKKDNEDDQRKLMELNTDVYIPLLDDPITSIEMEVAMNDMKKGGFDHRIDMFKIMMKVMWPLVLIVMNILFYISYPPKLALSILNALPKKGNLSLSKNYRGIQTLQAFGVLFDRIITNRFKFWLGVNDEQSAFQKFKSTIHQLFTIRLIIELAKKLNITLYIGLFDLEKAFDKVSRYQMLKKLITKGNGNCMLQTLKHLYSCTWCILCYGEEFSKAFRTFTGIRYCIASFMQMILLS